MDALSSQSDSGGREHGGHEGAAKRHSHAHASGSHSKDAGPDTDAVANLQEPHRAGKGLSEMAIKPVSPELAIKAIRAAASIVEVAPKDFLSILERAEKPLVISARGGILRRRFSYVVSFRGLTFVTRSRERLTLPEGTDVIAAVRMWLPD